MKIRHLVERVVVYGAAVAFLNYFSLPLGTFAASEMFKNDTKDKRIQQVCKTDSFLEDIVSNIDVKNCEVLRLVKTAHAITSKWLSIDNNKPIIGEKKRALEEGKAVCKYFATFTYSNFLYLVDKFGREDLKDKVRMCVGFVTEKGEVDGAHVWLQFYSQDKWQNYETTIDLIRKESKINFGSLDFEIFDSYVLGDEDYFYSSFVHHEDDKLVAYTNGVYSIESGIEGRHFFKYIAEDCAAKSKEIVNNLLKKLKEQYPTN